MRQGQTKLRTGDQVEVIAGKDKDRVGKILNIDRKNNAARVEGLNMVTKHIKPRGEGQSGQRTTMEAPIHMSNLMLICPECAKKVRIGYKILEDGVKVRACKNCGATIESTKK